MHKLKSTDMRYETNKLELFANGLPNALNVSLDDLLGLVHDFSVLPLTI